MEKLFIQNREGLKMSVVIDEDRNQKGLVFLMHGFLGFKEQPLLLEVAKIFRQNNFTTVSFDTINSLGESDGKMEDGTMSGYFENLEDVINWAKSHKFYQEQFFLVGHSLGGYCVANYAAKNKNVKNLILLCPVISGELFQQTNDIKEILEEWKETGVRVWNSRSNPGVIKKSSYRFIEDGRNHDLLKTAQNIKCSVLMIGGDIDEVIPLEHQKLLFDKIESRKEMHIIKNGDHNLESRENLEELSNIINNWIKS